MAINLNTNLSSISSLKPIEQTSPLKPTEQNIDFGKAIAKQLNNVNAQHHEADNTIIDLLSGKNQDINSVVASVAKADMSFKLLVGVRNKLVSAYKETMKMQI